MRVHFSARYVDTTIRSYLCFDYANYAISILLLFKELAECVKNCNAPFYCTPSCKGWPIRVTCGTSINIRDDVQDGTFSHQINCMRMIWARPCFVVQLGSLPRYDGTQGAATGVPTKICLQHVIRARARMHTKAITAFAAAATVRVVCNVDDGNGGGGALHLPISRDI